MTAGNKKEESNVRQGNENLILLSESNQVQCLGLRLWVVVAMV